MNDSIKVDDVLLEIESDFRGGVRADRTDNRMTLDDWEAQPEPEEVEEE